MMAKIVKGKGFKGVVNYVLGKQDARLIDADGVRLTGRESITGSFIAQAAANPRLSRTVGHISLDFSAQDKEKLTDRLMVTIARDYMERMGIENTQYIIVRHHDTDHPHIHIVFNRVDNSGQTISDKNDRFRSEKICKTLTEKYGLYFAQGKENVKRHRLKEPDKTKYEIYNALKKHVPRCKDWTELLNVLKREGITVQFKYKGNTGEKQGIIFDKNGYGFNGSKVDRMFSYTKIDRQLQENRNRQEQKPAQAESTATNQSVGIVESVSNVFGIFDFKPHGDDYEEEKFIRRMKKKQKKKSRKL
jgi:hypothetical protein